MNQKVSIIFIMNNLNCGGAEKALISLLQAIDYSQFNVDLLLFKREGIFINKVPKQVNILDEPYGYSYFDMPIKKAIFDSLKAKRFDITFYRAAAGLIFRNEQNNAKCEQRVWKYLSKSLTRLDKKYDIAIGYLEKNPIYYCIEKIDAIKKIGFIHNDYEQLGMDTNIDRKYFDKLDHIITVSKNCAEVLEHKFPYYKNKVEIMHNIISPEIINNLALEKISVSSNAIKIISLGRLHPQKGFEMAIEACKKLIDQNYLVEWSVIGEGNERKKLEYLIEKNHLQKHFFLLGMKENPYPFIKAADIYVQPSRFEGKSIAVDEAKILHKPIVVTNFSTVSDQITNNKTGLIVNMDSESIAKGIQILIEDSDLRRKLTKNLSKEKLGTESEIEKLYHLINVG